MEDFTERFGFVSLYYSTGSKTTEISTGHYSRSAHECHGIVKSPVLVFEIWIWIRSVSETGDGCMGISTARQKWNDDGHNTELDLVYRWINT